MLCTGNCTVGSNPTLSANRLRISDCGLRIGIFLIPQSEFRNPQSLSGSGRRAIARLQTRQAGNGATVAVLGCAAASPEPDQLRQLLANSRLYFRNNPHIDT